MKPLRFDIFGRIVAIQREGADLFDLFHEDATPGNGDVRRLGPDDIP